MSFSVDQRDDTLVAELLGGFGRAEADGFLDGRRQIVDPVDENHLLLLFAGFLGVDGWDVDIHSRVVVTSLKADDNPIVGD